MRPIDADNLRGRVCEIFLCAEPGSAEERRLALVLGLIDSEHTITPPPNDPLTLEELREIDGGPVWCVGRSGEGRWGIVHFYDDDGFECYMTEYGRIDGWCYGSDGEYGWLAYRRRPEERAK